MDHRFKIGDHVQERGKERVMTVLAYNDRTPDDHPGLDMRPPPRPMVTCVWSEGDESRSGVFAESDLEFAMRIPPRI